MDITVVKQLLRANLYHFTTKRKNLNLKEPCNGIQKNLKLMAAAQQEAEKARQSSMSLDELMVMGEKIYTERCAVCHQPTGLGIPGAFPALKGSPVATGDVNTHINVVVNGRSGTAMQAFGNQLTEQEIAAVISYERNAWGNDTGDAVQASDINAFKSQGTETGEEGQ